MIPSAKSNSLGVIHEKGGRSSCQKVTTKPLHPVHLTRFLSYHIFIGLQRLVGVIQIRGSIFAVNFKYVFSFYCYKAMDLVWFIFNFMSNKDFHVNL